jgi:ABC-2 type transport system ATP-binding protein
MIETENLTKTFGNVLAVDKLNIKVGEGEIFGFLGPNGAGKTTTVRMLTCLISPTSGTARINGFQVGSQDQEIRRTVGILTETPGFYDNLSAMKNLVIFARLYEVTEPEKQVEKYLQMLGLWDRRDDETGTFSKGMKQRLAIARALLHEPQVVFLDEPTAGLDPEAARMVRDFILELKHQSRTVFLCTHNLDEADRLCDHIAVFKTRLLVFDTPGRLRTEVFGRKVVLHLADPEPELADKISKLPYVHNASFVDSKLVAGVDDPETNNPALIRFLVGQGAQIQFVGELRRSLEDVYLELVRSK